jgi:hypothetical protein
VIKRHQRTNHGRQHGLWMRVAPKSQVETGHLFVNLGVRLDDVHEFLFLPGFGQSTGVEQIGDIEKLAFLGQLFDGLAAIEQFAILAVDIGNLRTTRNRGQGPGIAGEQTRLAGQHTDVDAIMAVNWFHDR